MRRLALLAVTLLLTGCTMGPDYVRPGTDVPASFRSMPGDLSQTADSEWWKQFNDPVLDGIIAEALAGNKSVKIAAANIEQAAGILMSTRSYLFPQISYSGAASRQYVSRRVLTAAPKNPYNSFQVLAGATWEVDLWGRIRRLTEAAEANVLGTVEARRGVILSLVAEAAASYIQLRALDEQLLIAKRTLKTYEETVKLFELQFRYGQVSRLNVEQARSQYESAAASIPQIELRIVETENAISLLLGRNPGPVPRGRSLSELAVPPVPVGLPSDLLDRRPDILQAEEQLIEANARIGAARALYFPSISLTGALGTSSEQLKDLFRGPAGTWSYSGSIVGPIFTAGAIRGQVEQAQAAQRAALFNYEQTIQSAFADAENAFTSRESLARQLAAEEKRVTALREYSKLAWLQYNGGYAPYLMVLNAEQQLFPAELNKAQAGAAALISVVNIYRALGGGWVAKAEKTAGGGVEAPQQAAGQKK